MLKTPETTPKKPKPKPAVKPTVNYYYGDRRQMLCLLMALIAVLVYFGYVAYLGSQIPALVKQAVKQSHPNIQYSNEQPPPRYQ